MVSERLPVCGQLGGGGGGGFSAYTGAILFYMMFGYFLQYMIYNHLA